MAQKAVGMAQHNWIIAACSVLVLICSLLAWKFAIVPKMPWFYSNFICAWCFFQDREDLEYDVFVTDFFEMHDSQMDEQIEIWDEVIGKLKNGYNNRRYKIVSDKSVEFRAAVLIEIELKRMADLSKRTIAIVTRRALESQLFQLTVQALTSINRDQKLIVILSEPNLLEQLQVHCEPLADHIKNHSYLVYEEQDFWEKLHYKLPHKKMKKKLPKQTEIELENQPFVNQNSV